LAFTTTVGAGGTSLIGTSGVDTTTFAPGTLATAVWIGAQGDTDFVTLQTNQANNYTIYGGGGVDTITAAGLRNSILKADDGNDVITINTNALQDSTVSGLEGNDNITIDSNVNGALVNGNNGTDTLNVGTSAALTLSNNGKIVGGQGNDTFTVGSAGNAVTLTSGLINGQDGDDTITIANIANMTFGGGATIFGGQGSDIITQTDNSRSVVSGDLGADNITTGGGNDTVFGGDGNDRITAAGGADSVIGGSGIDTFASTNATSVASTANTLTAGGILATETITFGNGVDVITDFSAGSNGDIFSNGNGITLATNLLGQTTTLANNTTYMLSGNFSNGVFTVAAGNSGSDTLIANGAAATTLNASAGVTILTGVNLSQLVAANFA